MLERGGSGERKIRNRVRNRKSILESRISLLEMETHVIETRKSLSERKFKGGR